MQNKKVSFHYLDVKFFFKNRETVKQFILELFKREGKKVDTVNYIFCTDEYLIDLNMEYLNHDTYTDIITFFYSENDQPVLSDIYISIERVKENAVQFQTSIKNELLRVLFHGALHLCGYKDKKAEEEKLMREKEEYYLKLFNAKH
ncbi:rRNA maturation RNase YbeY [Chitinophagaceae bacterium LB-8]|uniref:Endoribonuclease YbeY n=1 Tax=Paraflavisolibacter caeni TaxID=2982496 RepID=A0A9X3B8N2_9BACT|nr:rRNA maturation RNase YbeY [Paraflavisolibacter caeni]MCU7550955.1 rRNA maturation RNase YbeY [Paraflavisolibacter caeni]